MGTHSIASPSSARMWYTCANSLAANVGQPEGDTVAANLGTDKHDILSRCLQDGTRADSYLGKTTEYGNNIDEEFVDHVQTVLDNVRARISNYDLLGGDVHIFLETKVPIDHITGEKDATGTADIILAVDFGDKKILDVIDAKFGFMEVLAEDNLQLLMYASGAMREHPLGFNEINIVIEQPLRGSSEWRVSPEEVDSAIEKLKPAAEKALKIYENVLLFDEPLKIEDFSVSEKGCQWCNFAAGCPARIKHIEETMEAGFESLPDTCSEIQEIDLSKKFEALPLIESWCESVRSKVNSLMLNGKQVPGLKLVKGRDGNRRWASDEEAEELMKKFRVSKEDMYTKKLNGPAKILELFKDQGGRRQQLEALVVRAEGKPQVVLESDKRPAVEINLDDGFDLC